MLDSCRNLTVRTLNEETGLFELGKIGNIYRTGVKTLLKLETENGYQLKCSSDHAILTEDGWVKAGDLNENQKIAVSGIKSRYEGRQYPPSLRTGIGVWTSMQRNSKIHPVDTCYQCGSSFERRELVLDHIIPVVADLSRALDVKNLAPMCFPCHRLKTNTEQSLAVRGQGVGSKFIKFKLDPSFKEEGMTYDLSVEGPWHNFVANGIIVHNSYNEASGRYKELEPVFYVPGERNIVQQGKPGAYEFIPGTDKQHEVLTEILKGSYEDSYYKYVQLLDNGIAKEVARMCLPVGIYSSQYATCNARSLMAFLSLRTKKEDSTFPSYPQREIEMVAEQMEEVFSKLFPLTYDAFDKHGRVG